MHTKRLFWPDFIRATAISLVVLTHTIAPLVTQYGHLSPYRWEMALVLRAISRASVPLFFMLLGALYLGREIAPLPFLRQRARRLLLPFFFWSFLYDYKHLAPLNLTALWNGFRHIVQENTSGHLWFFYTLFGLYLFLPVLTVIVLYGGERMVRYYLWVWLLVASFFPLLDRLTEIYPGFTAPWFANYSGYLVLGYWLRKRFPPEKVRPAYWLALALGSLVSNIWLLRHDALQSGSFQAWGLGLLTPQIILWSAAAFVLLRAAARRFPFRWRPLVQSLSRASFGIYLVHVLIIHILVRLRLDVLTFQDKPWLWPGLWLAVILLSWAFTLTLQRIPVLRRLAP